ncbi:MAG: DEAD/DEAH box helicase [Ktedonobacteraceae bacterium]
MEDRAWSYADVLLAELQAWNECQEQIVSSHVSPARGVTYADVEEEVRALLPGEIQRLYAHQALTVEHALRQEHVTLATATASGKTLALALPARIRRTLHNTSMVLCIAPTRALVEQWCEYLRAWDPTVVVESYTQDTPESERGAIRRRVQCLVTTPDMMHVSLLAHHNLWSHFLSNLQDVIIDESHIYRGVFGSHMSHLLRRLQRILHYYHAPTPTFLFASATIGNPAEHASLLLNQPVRAITQNGAPSGGRRIVLWQPPDKRSHSDEAAGLMAFFLERGVRTILFGQERQSVERIVRTVRKQLPASLRRQVVAYRAGYMAQERHAIERKLATKDLLGVVSTTALELGIDVGDLDVAILDGFPGTIASFWQQAGRAGRRERSALTILVLRDDALDQYFALHPEKLLGQPAEQALVNVSNPYILPAHLLCAAHERPLQEQDIAGFGPAARETIARLVEQKRLHLNRGRYYIRGDAEYVTREINLRQVGKRFTIMHAGRTLEDTDIHHAINECYPGAVYFSQGSSYVVEQLDLQQGEIHVAARDTAYYTEPFGSTDVHILETLQQRRQAHAELHVGDVLITHRVSGYVRKHQTYHNVLKKEELPAELEIPLETKAFWMTIDTPLIDELLYRHYDPAGALHAAEHSMIALLPLIVMGDRRDMGGVSILPAHPQTERATIFIYDGYPGGIGYAEEAYEQFVALARATYEALLACPCEKGCYACVQSPSCGNQNRILDKAGALYLLEMLL